jgi:hypothetical protein
VAAARVPGDLVERDAGEQPEGRGPGAAVTWGMSWHADKTRGGIVEHVHLLPAARSGHRVIDGDRRCRPIAALLAR